MKFGRKYRLTIDTDNGTFVIEPPFTIRFTVKRHVLASMNTLDIDIYNLSKERRDNIFQDQYYQPLGKRRHIKLEAGYDDLSTIFQGTFWIANSGREGVDIVTSICSTDGGLETENSFTFRTLQPQTGAPLTGRKIVQDLIGSFDPAQLSAGKISNGQTMQQNYQRPVVLNGNTYDLLKKYSNGKVFIDLEKIYVLEDNEVVEGGIPLINADTGLLSTPRRDEAYLTVSTLFEPRFIMGQSADLVSTVNPIYNGKYRVCGVQHQGIISEAVNGDCRTIVHLYDPTKYSGSMQVVN